MSKLQRVLLLALAGLALVVLFLMMRNPQPPVLPADKDHRWINADACLECHSTGGTHPRPDDHPIGRDCLRCHGQPNGR